MSMCNLVNALGIIIAQFPAGDAATLAKVGATKPMIIEYRGKLYQRLYEEGGGAPSFYEIRPDVVLRDQDIAKKI